MSKVRINDLARELEVKSRPILDALEAIGVTGKTHSSSIEADQAEKVREYFKNGSRTSGGSRPVAEAKPKFDLSKVSKPGDALKAILERKQAEAAARSMPPARQQPVVATPSAAHAAGPGSTTPMAAKPAPVAAAAPPAVATEAPAPRRIVPQPRPQGHVVAAPAAPAIASRPPAESSICDQAAGGGGSREWDGELLQRLRRRWLRSRRSQRLRRLRWWRRLLRQLQSRSRLRQPLGLRLSLVLRWWRALRR